MKKSMILILGLSILLMQTASSLTISPQLREKLIREGAWEQFAQQFRQWQEQLEATYGPSPLENRARRWELTRSRR